MFVGLENEFSEFQSLFAKYSENYFVTLKNKVPAVLWESMKYSFDSGGKRFRPFLIFLIGKEYQTSFSKLAALALAIEFIHTYSLIHDDLPCMDNDDFRRGKPTNHKKYGEDIALLAGDGLLTEAFKCLSSCDQISAELKMNVIHYFSDYIGAGGMVAGQVLDMKSDGLATIQDLENMHQRKTGDLISAAVVCSAMICGEKNIDLVKLFSNHLGLAFQIKDDLLDGLDGSQDHKSYLKILGFDKTKEKLNKHSDLAQFYLGELKLNHLEKMIHFNISRNH